MDEKTYRFIIKRDLKISETSLFTKKKKRKKKSITATLCYVSKNNGDIQRGQSYWDSRAV